VLGFPMPPPRAARIGRLKESGKVESRIRRAEGISTRETRSVERAGLSYAAAKGGSGVSQEEFEPIQMLIQGCKGKEEYWAVPHLAREG
jgi:hypothetical protein